MSESNFYHFTNERKLTEEQLRLVKIVGQAGGVNSAHQMQWYLSNFGRPLNTVIDIGANAGSVGLYAAKYANAERVVLVEPVNPGRIISNILRLKLDPAYVTVLPYAVNKTGEYVTLSELTEGQASYVYAEGGQYGKGYKDPEKVPGIAFLPLLNMFDEIDYLKIDVEGCEFDFLTPTPDVQNALKRVHFLDMEIHSQFRTLNNFKDGDFKKEMLSSYYTAGQEGDEMVRFLIENCGFSFYDTQIDNHPYVFARDSAQPGETAKLLRDPHIYELRRR